MTRTSPPPDPGRTPGHTAPARNADTPRDPWDFLRRFTDARIALGHVGGSLPTRAVLDFRLAHAQARDAVHLPLDTEPLAEALAVTGLPVQQVASRAPDRAIYLQRPDLGRRLDTVDRQRLQDLNPTAGATRPAYDLVFVIADGLSSLAVQHHSPALLDALLPGLRAAGWRLGPVVVASQARVAIGDEIGQTLGAACVAVLIGERPGLSSPDSLGVYLTYDPKPGRRDAERNCVSNIRPEGLSYAAAAHKLGYLLNEARRRKLTGVELKDEAPALAEAPPDEGTSPRLD